MVWLLPPAQHMRGVLGVDGGSAPSPVVMLAKQGVYMTILANNMYLVNKIYANCNIKKFYTIKNQLNSIIDKIKATASLNRKFTATLGNEGEMK
jgi:hypothetical protein